MTSQQQSASSMEDVNGNSAKMAAEIIEHASTNKCRVSMENFELIRVLGRGAYGKVFLVRKVGGSDNGRIYAMKVLKKSRVVQKPKTLQHTISERNVLEHIRKCPFLVSLEYAFQSDSRLHLVMDYVGGGELFTHLCSQGSFSMEATRFYVAELTVALENLHKLGIIYRDLKLENVMLDEHGHIILTDFGLSKEFEETDATRRTNSYCGTIEYMAPEVVKRPDHGYTEVVDWWSLGVMTFELLTGCSPFTVEGAKNSSREIAERILTKKVPFPRAFNPVAKDFVAKLLVKSGSDRLGSKGVDEIKGHRFFKGIDWAKLTAKQYEPPIVPKLNHALDVKNFADEFTKQPAVSSPAESPDDATTKKLFRGYSFVTPSVMLGGDNVISDQYLTSTDEVGIDVQKFGEDHNSPFFQQYVLDLSEAGFLGRGSFSVCRKCRNKETGAEFAVKIISQRYALQAIREAQILQLCKEHRNVVKLIEAPLQDKFHVYLVMELLRGPELLTKIRRANNFTESEASKIMRKLVSVVRFLHHKGIVHRDLKPENILFESDDADGDLRLVDFGFARLLPSAGRPLNTPCFTLHFAAPEVLHRKLSDSLQGQDADALPQYNQQCDLWSLGVILYTMLSGYVPFHARTKHESATDIMNRIRGAQFSFDGVEWQGVSDEAKDLISGLLTVDPDRRLDANAVLHHTWLRKGYSPQTPLRTPTILNSTAGETFNQTLNAFLTANKEGFHLADVNAARLAQRRRASSNRNVATRRSDDSGYGGPSPPLSVRPTDDQRMDVAEETRRSSQSSNESIGSGNSGGGTASSGQSTRKRKLVTVPEEVSSGGELSGGRASTTQRLRMLSRKLNPWHSKKQPTKIPGGGASANGGGAGAASGGGEKQGKTLAGGGRRPSSLTLGDPFMDYREPRPTSLRQTRETRDGGATPDKMPARG